MNKDTTIQMLKWIQAKAKILDEMNGKLWNTILLLFSKV